MITEETEEALITCLNEKEEETSIFLLEDLVNEYNERIKTNGNIKPGKRLLSLRPPVFMGAETLIAEMTKEEKENTWMLTKKTIFNYSPLVIRNIPNFIEGLRLRELMKELGITGKIYYKYYKNEIYVIIKGNPRARDILTGTRYKNFNPKIVKFGLSKVNFMTGFKGTGITALIFYGCAKAVEGVAMYFEDGELKPGFFSEVPADMTKIAISCLFATAIGFGCTTIGFPVAVGIGAALVVGYAIDIALDQIDEKIGFTKAVSDATKRLVNTLREDVNSFQRSLLEKGQTKVLEELKRVRIDKKALKERAFKRK